jgi:hypothetical protein
MNANDTEIKLAIDNMRKTCEVLDQYTNRPENYNSVYACYLQSLSWDIFRHANDLERIGVEFYV